MVKFIAAGMVLTAGIVGLSVAIDSRSGTANAPRSPLAGPTADLRFRTDRGGCAEIKLRPQLAGRVARLLVKEGQIVQAGETLLELDDAEYVQDVALAEAELHLAKAQLQRLVHGAHGTQRAEAAAIYRAKLAELERAQLTRRRVRRPARHARRDGAGGRQLPDPRRGPRRRGRGGQCPSPMAQQSRPSRRGPNRDRADRGGQGPI